MAAIRTTGRKAGQAFKKKAGRPRNNFVDSYAAKAWINALRARAGNVSAYAVGVQVAKQLHYSVGYLPRFDKFAEGAIGPRDATLADTEKVFPGSRIVFDNGPEGVELWDALDGNFEKLWEIIDPACDSMPFFREMQQSHREKAGALLDFIFEHPPIPKELPQFIDVLPTRTRYAPNIIQEYCTQFGPHQEAWAGGHYNFPELGRVDVRLNLSFSKLAAFISMWRLSMLIIDCLEEMDYVMTGLLKQAIPDMLAPYGIAEEVVGSIRQKQDAYRKWLHPKPSKEVQPDPDHED